MKNSLTLAALAVAMNTQASVLGPSQIEGTSFRIYDAQHSLAQTFISHSSMTIDRIELIPDSWLGPGRQPLTISIYQLADHSSPIGILLGAISVPNGLGTNWGFAGVDVENPTLLLQSGSLYSLVFRSSYSGDTSYANALGYNNSGDIYPEGEMWLEENGSWRLESSWVINDVPGISDMAFKIYGTEVPLPGSGVAFLSGLAALVRFSRRRN